MKRQSGRRRLFNDGIRYYFHSRLNLEGEVTLRNVAEYSYQHGGKHFGRSRVKTAPFYKEFQEYIVKQDAHAYQQGIAEQLYPFSHYGRFGEYDIAGKYKTGREADTERHNESRNVRRYHKAANADKLFLQYKIVTDKIYKDVNYSIAAATCEIPERLLINPFGERLMEKIDGIKNDIFNLEKHERQK